MSNTITVPQLMENFAINSIFAKSVLGSLDSQATLEDAARFINDKPKPFVKWVGGKRQLLKQFREMGLYPPSEFNPLTSKYFEPFVGGGAVFFDLLPNSSVLSDMNFELITAYRVIRDDVDGLITSLQKHIYDKDYYLSIRAQDIQQLSDIEIASRFIYLNRTGFNGMYRVNSKGGFNVPFGRYKNPQICDEVNLRRVSESLKDVEIKHGDYKNVLDSASSGDFVYFDPPYYPVSKTASFTSYTKDGFLEQEQMELRDTFEKLSEMGCYVMLSNSDTPFIRDLYSKVGSARVSVVMAGRAINSKAGKRGKIKEVLVTNY